MEERKKSTKFDQECSEAPFESGGTQKKETKKALALVFTGQVHFLLASRQKEDGRKGYGMTKGVT